MKEGQAILEEKKEEMSKLEAEEAQLQKKQIDVKHDVEKYENLVKENQAKSKHWKKEVCLCYGHQNIFHSDKNITVR